MFLVPRGSAAASRLTSSTSRPWASPPEAKSQRLSSAAIRLAADVDGVDDGDEEEDDEDEDGDSKASIPLAVDEGKNIVRLWIRAPDAGLADRVADLVDLIGLLGDSVVVPRPDPLT